MIDFQERMFQEHLSDWCGGSCTLTVLLVKEDEVRKSDYSGANRETLSAEQWCREVQVVPGVIYIKYCCQSPPSDDKLTITGATYGE